MSYRKKLVEVALPLEAISASCKADKDRRTGTIRNLHKWFSPMPLPAWRALLFASLIDDPVDADERERLFTIIEGLAPPDGAIPSDQAVREARAEIEAKWHGQAPTVVDPFCGGGSTLVEARRLGLNAEGSDLNPVPADVKPRVLSTAIDLDNAVASLELALEVAEYFELKQASAKLIAAEVGVAVAAWRKEAKRIGLAPAEIERMASAFEHADLKAARALGL